MRKKFKKKLLISLFIFIVFIGLIVIYFNKPKNEYIESINYDEFIIYYINLDRSVKRRENVEKLLKENDLIGNRISAVDGKKIDIDDAKYKKYFKKSKTAYNHYKEDYDTDKKHIGHFGCFLSHMKTFEKFLETNYKYAIIFEDDMEIENFKNKLNKHIKNVPRDWDVILLQYNIDKSKGENGKFEFNNNILKINGNFTGTCGYIINRNSAKILLKELEDHSWFIDYNMGDLSKENKLNIYGVYPQIVCQPTNNFIQIPSLNLDFTDKCDTEMGGMSGTMSE